MEKEQLINTNSQFAILRGTDIIDWEIKNKKNNFIMEIINIKCPLCGYVLINRTSKILKEIAKHPDVSGCETACEKCNEKFYIHYQINETELYDLFKRNYE